MDPFLSKVVKGSKTWDNNNSHHLCDFIKEIIWTTKWSQEKREKSRRESPIFKGNEILITINDSKFMVETSRDFAHAHNNPRSKDFSVHLCCQIGGENC